MKCNTEGRNWTREARALTSRNHRHRARPLTLWLCVALLSGCSGGETTDNSPSSDAAPTDVEDPAIDSGAMADNTSDDAADEVADAIADTLDAVWDVDAGPDVIMTIGDAPGSDVHEVEEELEDARSRDEDGGRRRMQR